MHFYNLATQSFQLFSHLYIKYISMKNTVFCLLILFMLSSCRNKSYDYTMSTAQLNTGTTASLRGLFVVDNQTVWASGSEGTVLRSVDGGNNWEIFHPDTSLTNDFRSIHAWDENSAIVFGISGPDFAYKTSDGGKNWKVVYRDTTSGLFFNSIKFANNNVGLAVSDPIDGQFFLLKTSDSGETWNRIKTLPPSQDGEANFAASNTCIEFLPDGHAWIASGGSAARVFYSKDFGETWEVSETPMLQNEGPAGIYSITFKDAKNGIIVGGIYNQPEINQKIAAYTCDGGKTWTEAMVMPNGFRSCVQLFTDRRRTYAVAMGKTGFNISMDMGKTWSFPSNIGYYTFRSVPGQPYGFAAGADGEIAFFDFSIH